MSEEDDNVIRLAQLKANNPFGNSQQNRAEERPNINSTKDAIDIINKDHFKTFINGKFKVVRENPDGTLEMMEKKSFQDGFLETKLSVKYEGKDDPKSTPIADIWLNSSQARKFNYGLEFDPSHAGHKYNGKYNLFKGLKIHGVDGDVSPFIDLMKNIICSGHEDNFKFLVALISQMFQQPHMKPGVAVVIRGDEGVGKSFFIEKLCALIDPYHFKTSNPAYVFGDHNGQLKNVILLHLEEAVWAGSKKDESLLKDLITGPTLPINDKYVPVYLVANHLHLFISGNPEWLVSAGFKARRIFALKASEAHIRDTDYFKRLDDWFKGGGAGALMHYFLNYKSDVDLRVVPVTDELIVQKQKSMPPVAEWLYSIVNSGEMPYGEVIDGRVMVIKQILANDYNHSPSGKRHQMNEMQFGNQLKDLLPEMETKDIKIRDSRDIRRNGYKIPDLVDCRRMLEANIGGKIRWHDGGEEWICLKGNTDFDFSMYKPGGGSF
jgi:Family of unknown function (DUF5906)